MTGSSLSVSQARDIVRPFTMDEIELSLWGMNDNVSPSQDGSVRAFNLVKEDLLNNLLSDFHNCSADLRAHQQSIYCAAALKVGC
jgi:hypothetical protein